LVLIFSSFKLILLLVAETNALSTTLYYYWTINKLLSIKLYYRNYNSGKQSLLHHNNDIILLIFVINYNIITIITFCVYNNFILNKIVNYYLQLIVQIKPNLSKQYYDDHVIIK